MLFRPDRRDFNLIGYYAGKVIYGVGLVMLVPAAIALVLGEYNDVAGFTLAAALAVAVGRACELFLYTREPLSTSHGLAAVALSWLLAPLFAGLPLLLSGHFASLLDAYFEAMSGFATIGLTLVNDVDHMSRSANLWRHLMQFVGGQGIVVVVLTIFASAGGRVGHLYTGEGRAEKILPNVVRTARFIWRVSFVYFMIGTAALWASLVHAGLHPATALYHAANLFMSAFGTGGYAPMSTSVAFYRSPVVEIVLAPIMAAGAFSFALHYQLWMGRRGELARNIETRTIAASTLLMFAVMAVGLGRTGTFVDLGPLLRHSFFQLISAHTTTGLSTLPGRLFVTDWGVLAPAVLVTAMALGGMAGSTAGGIKAIRIGLILKGLMRDIRKVLLPEDAIVIEKYHSTTTRILTDEQVRAAATILLLWLVLYLGGGLIGLFYGYDLQVALFESTSAASSAGLSVGLVRPDLEWPLKVVYIAEMVIGRLEFIAVFALLGYLVAIVRGRV
ncbi:MAG TPA: potassium transporter TrkG [Euzebyales bacterium]|nr:potassium transporter TrkG [Euzebyales bacterium]